MLTTTHKLNSGAEVTLSNNVYDELGRLKTNKRNGNSKLNTDYKYNVRSWTKSITNPLFSQTLYYNDKRGSGMLNTPTYNGNISGMDWTGGKGYNFMYDNLSRLTSAEHLDTNVSSIMFNIAYSYDKHGNMLTSSRNVNQTTAVENLTFTYQGNQLMRTDGTGVSSTLPVSMDFKDGTNTGDDYAYDTNGNLIKDLNKNVSDIQYNVLNLPNKVTFGDGNSVSYMYAANGSKLQTVHTINGTTTTTDYVGNMIYENGTLKRTLVDAGYIENDEYYFYIQDHLGNNRVVAKQDGTIVQTSDYYPFGVSFAENTATDAQPYKYNGKELDTKGRLNLYDYGARHYDPVLGRFMTVDPMAEKYYSISPYVYCANNPINCIDLKGDSISVADLYARDKQGKLINPNQVEAFEFLANTKEGKALLANYAGKGQTIAGVSFDKNGKFHSQGVNISFGADVRDSSISGTTSFSLDDGNLNIQVVVGDSSDKYDLLDTFIHEIAIHADQNSVDFSDDKVMNNSNAYPALRKMKGKRGFTQHWQERNVNRAMERIGLPIIQQYYKSKGVTKSKDTILKSAYGFIN